MKNVERVLYENRLAPFAGNGNAKVITGIRRSGKSTFLYDLCSKIGKNRNIICINMELWENRDLRDPDRLYSYVKKAVNGKKENILVIDEVQDIDRWEEVIRSIIAERICDVYITGSNSKLLSGEYSTYLSGRLNTLNMFTLTYSECMRFNEQYNRSSDCIMERFLHIGGFPSVWRLGYSESDALSEIRDIVQAIMMRDIVSRHQIKKIDVLERIIRFICDSIGSRLSVNNIFKILHSENANLGVDTVYSFINYLESACLIYKCESYDLKGKTILKTGYKYYVADIGIKNALYGFRPGDIGGYLENIVYLELRSRGYDVRIGDNAGREIDFIAEKNGKKAYIQVTTRLSDESVVEREYGSMIGIDDGYSKYVVVSERSPLNADVDGVQCVTLEEFLLKKEL